MAGKKRAPIVAGGFVEEREGQTRLVLDSRHVVWAALKPWVGKRVVITIAEEEQARSLRQNAFLWGVVYRLMALESGYSADDLHELMKLRHNSKLVVDPRTGEEVRVGKSTTHLSVEDFGIFIERVMVDGAEWLGISFPEPQKHEEWRDRKVPA